MPTVDGNFVSFLSICTDYFNMNLNSVVKKKKIPIILKCDGLKLCVKKRRSHFVDVLMKEMEYWMGRGRGDVITL